MPVTITQINNNDALRKRVLHNALVVPPPKTNGSRTHKQAQLHYANSPGHRRAAVHNRLASKAKDDGDEVCVICQDDLTGGDEHLYVAGCGHKFHRGCISEMASHGGSSACALCREPLVVKGVKPPDAWYVKYQGRPGYRWLDKYLAKKALEAEFEDVLSMIQLSSELEQ